MPKASKATLSTWGTKMTTEAKKIRAGSKGMKWQTAMKLAGAKLKKAGAFK